MGARGQSPMVAVGNHGSVIPLRGVHPRKELLEACGSSHAEKVYCDKKDGSTVHIGYIVRGEWFTLYRRVEHAA